MWCGVVCRGRCGVQDEGAVCRVKVSYVGGGCGVSSERCT